MNKFIKIIMSGALAAAMGCGMAALTGCGGNETGGEGLSGELDISGSTSVNPLMLLLADAFENENPDVSINVGAGGSSAGISDAKQGKVDFGMASKEVDEADLTTVQIAIDGIALIVNSACTVTEVTKDEVYSLYVDHTAVQGTVADAVSRDASSGTREAFEELIGIKGSDASIYDNMPEFSNQGLVVNEIESNNNVMGYVSLEALAGNSKIKGLNYKATADATAVAPTTENVKNGSYTLSRPFNLVYNTKNGLSELAKAFLDFIFSEEGAAIIAANGQITVERN